LQYQLEHRFNWRGNTRDLLQLLYTDPGLSDALSDMRHLKSREVTHLEVDTVAGRAKRIVRVELDMPVPGVLKRRLGADNADAIGNHLGWEEHSTCDFDALTIDFDIHLPHLDTRITAGGRYQLRNGTHPGEVARHIDGHVRIDIPMVARMAERLIVSRLKDNMEEEARITAAFLHDCDQADADATPVTEPG